MQLNRITQRDLGAYSSAAGNFCDFGIKKIANLAPFETHFKSFKSHLKKTRLLKFESYSKELNLLSPFSPYLQVKSKHRSSLKHVWMVVFQSQMFYMTWLSLLIASMHSADEDLCSFKTATVLLLSYCTTSCIIYGVHKIFFFYLFFQVEDVNTVFPIFH